MTIPDIGWLELLISMAPILLVVTLFIRWSLPIKELLIATTRMLIQLLAIGFALIYIFKQDDWRIGLSLMSFMLLVSAWIAIRPLQDKSPSHLLKMLFGLMLGCGFILAIIIAGVLDLTPWYQPRFVIPLAGMLLANTMNCLSLAGERLESELSLSKSLEKARNAAFSSAMIPQINSLLAVGLVALPGMMTGQILSGVSPLFAVRYQIVIMAGVLCSATFSLVIYLSLKLKA